MACNCGKSTVKKTDAKQVTRKSVPSTAIKRTPSVRRIIRRPAK